MIQVLAIAVALFFAMNIGGSGSASSMASAYGGRVVNKRIALILMALFAWLGAVFAGKAVIRTVSNGIVSSEFLQLDVALIVLISASLTLFFANLLKIPLSTSQVTVGAVAAIGIYYGVLRELAVAIIVAAWVIIPIASYAISYLLGKYVEPHFMRWLTSFGSEETFKKILSWVVIASGCWVAFSVGANNAANAMGPLVGAGLINVSLGAMLGGVFIGLGALVLGGRTLHTTGREITELCVVKSSFVSITAGSLIIVASLLGIPSPLAQATTLAIVGMGAAKCGREETFSNGVVGRIFKIWVISPTLSFLLAFTLIHTKLNVFEHQQGNILVSIMLSLLLMATVVGLFLAKKRIGLSR